jgi:hypothetical protein
MANIWNPNTINSDLVACLDAANVRSYSGSGSTWYDISGNGNNGSISSGEFVADATTGGYLRNSGNVSNFFYISMSHSTSLNTAFTGSGWTIEEVIWTNSVDYPEADAGAVASGAAYGAGATGFDWNHGYGNTSFNTGASSNSASGYEDNITINLSSPYTSLNAWRVRTMVWNKASHTFSLYINGASMGSGSLSGTAGTAIYDGGGINFGTLYGWKHFGRRASIKIYSKFLTATEVDRNFNAVRSRFGL